MKYRNLGNSGLQVSIAGLGCNNFGGRLDSTQSGEVIAAALDLGVTFFDTADSYGRDGGSESVLGEFLGSHRKNVVLATKFGRATNNRNERRGASRRYIMSAVEASLRRLKTDWIDLYQMHFPDPMTPIEETLRALDDLICQGKVRYIGCSNLSAWQIADAEWTARARSLNRFVSAQDEYSVLIREIEKDLVPAIRHYGIGLIAYRPLASGLLSGKYAAGTVPPEGTRLSLMKHHADRYMTAANLDLSERLGRYARSRGCSLIDIALSWVAFQTFVSSVIFGASTPEQVRANVGGINWPATASDFEEVGRIFGSIEASV